MYSGTLSFPRWVGPPKDIKIPFQTTQAINDYSKFIKLLKLTITTDNIFLHPNNTSEITCRKLNQNSMTDMWNPEKIFLLGGGGCNGIQWMQGHLTLCFFLIIKNIYYILTVYHCIFFLYVHVMVIFFDDEKICNVRCLWLLLTFSLLKRFKLMLNINIWCWLNNTQHIYLILKYFLGCIKWIKTIYYNVML